MATRLFDPFKQFVTPDGKPAAGYTLEFYAAGTLDPKDTFSDAGLTVANGAITINSFGWSPVPIFAGYGDYRVILKDADGVVVGDEDPVAGASTDATAAGASFRNLLVNGDFSINQRAATSVADDTYCLDRWYALTNTGSVTVAQQSLQSDGMPWNIRLTQPDVAAKYMGVAQIIEATDCRFVRGAPVTLSGRVRCSVAAPIRYAILSWTGTADTVTSDVVLDWTSTSYTAGGFFLAANLVVQAVGSITPSAATWTSIAPITATISSAMNNLIVVFWTEGTAAQNVTLAFGNVQLEAGSSASLFEHLPRASQLARCWRYYQKSFELTTAPAQNTGPATALRFVQAVGASTTQSGMRVNLAAPMRNAAYTLTLYNPSAANAQMRNNTTSADCSSTGATATGSDKFSITTVTAAGTAAGNSLLVHYTAEHEL